MEEKEISGISHHIVIYSFVFILLCFFKFLFSCIFYSDNIHIEMVEPVPEGSITGYIVTHLAPPVIKI
jgi:hypothetical protein